MRPFLPLLLSAFLMGPALAQPTPTMWLVSRTPEALLAANLGGAMRSNGLALVEETLYYRHPRTLKEGQVDFLRTQTIYDCNTPRKFKIVTVAGFQAGQAAPVFDTKQDNARWGIAPAQTNLTKQWTAACKNGEGATPLRSVSSDQQILQAFRQQTAPARSR